MLRRLFSKKLKRDGKGFTLIEVVIAMAIFGFLLYIITAILLVVVTTVNQINQRSFLRSQMESSMNTMVREIQFATNVVNCGAGCLAMTTPSTEVKSGVVGEVIKTIKFYTIANGAGNTTVAEDVTINSSSTTTTSYLLPANVSVTSLTFNIEQGNILVAMNAQVNDKAGKKIIGLTLSSNVQYNKQ